MAYHKKPRGRPRKGCRWDTAAGKWVPEEMRVAKEVEIDVTKGIYEKDKGTKFVQLYDYLDSIELPEDLKTLNLNTMYEDYVEKGGVVDKSEFFSTAEGYLNLPLQGSFEDYFDSD